LTREPIPEARLVEGESGLVPEGDGWYVVNVADAAAMGIDEEQYAFLFEGRQGNFGHFGINVTILGPGKPAAMYHSEAGQEGFLVLFGECILVVEETERVMRQWDYFHCPPNTAHVIVGAGAGPCAILMVGARNAGEDLLYPASPAAARHGASVAEDTPEASVAYADWQPLRPGRYPWPPA
jgi:uncharacterized cupin superfamily protein